MAEPQRADEPIVIAAHENGVAIFRAAREGLARETSPDGVRWQAANPEAGDAGPLRPICSAGRSGEAQLLCTDPEGRMMGVALKYAQASLQSVAAGGRLLSLNERFRP